MVNRQYTDFLSRFFLKKIVRYVKGMGIICLLWKSCALFFLVLLLCPRWCAELLCVHQRKQFVFIFFHRVSFPLFLRKSERINKRTKHNSNNTTEKNNNNNMKKKLCTIEKEKKKMIATMMKTT